jgi:hypothetical protein
MDTQLIIPEIFDNAMEKLGKSELLTQTMQELITKYEQLLSSTIVTSYRCKSIERILVNNNKDSKDEKYLLEQLNLSKRLYNKTLKQK